MLGFIKPRPATGEHIFLGNLIPELPIVAVTHVNILAPIGPHLQSKTQVEILVNHHTGEALMFQHERHRSALDVQAVQVMPLGIAVVEPDDHFRRIVMTHAGELRRHAGKRGEIGHRLCVDVDGI